MAHTTNRRVNMAAYNTSSGPCFGGETRVLLATGTGRKEVPCAELRKGDRIVSGLSGEMSRIRCVIETVSSEGLPVIQFNDCNLSVTPWHPINVMGRWMFPADFAEKSDTGHLRVVPRVFNFILEEEARDHTILLDGRYPAVLLGHGLTDEEGVLNHKYFANYGSVVADLSEMEGWQEGHVILDAAHCVDRDPKTNHVCKLVSRITVD